ncbi:MAG TPA: hypothetical protein VMR97_10340 [Acidimicrobiales bacterium]|nr:hypothetical protein [Acidimicrobiales bacterium]
MHIRSCLLLCALSLAVASALAACGSGPGATTSSSSAAGPVLSGKQKTLAKQSLIRLSDFPAGWSSQGSVTTSGSSGLTTAQDAQLTHCLKVNASDIDTHVPHWSSPTFSDGSGAATVNDAVSVYAGASKAAADFSTFSDPRTPGCLVGLLGGPLEKQISKQLQPGQSVGQVSASARPLPSYGQRSGDIELVVPIDQGTQVVPVYIDVIVVLYGRAESTITASSPATPLSSGLADQLALAVAERMRPISGQG